MRRVHVAAWGILVSLSIGMAVPTGSAQGGSQEPSYAAHPGFTFREGRSRAIDVTPRSGIPHGTIRLK